MRSRTLTSSASAVLLLTASLVSAKHGAHEHLEDLHKRHRATRELARSVPEAGEQGIEIRSITPETATSEGGLAKRGGQCAFPTDAGLVAVTPGSQNAGWAMSPNQPCKPGNYCPYACPPGEVSVQWDPSATSYSYPKSMNGGLYCDNNGNIQKPFPSKPYCQPTASNIGVVNNAAGVVSFCQTVLPGNEAMLIPTAVNDYATLANPGTDYWCGTAAHYYINPPGTGTDEACVWGSNSNPVGNWSPYVAGSNVDASGETFIKLGWNPIYLETATPFRNNMPTWGVKIECPDGGCNGLPCAIDPAQNKVNQMLGSASSGAGGGAFCVVTVPKGSTANFVVYDASGGAGKGGQFYQSTSPSLSSTSEAPSSTSASSSTSEWSSSSSYASSSTTTWSSYNETSTKSSSTHSAMGSPYYSLFNHTSTAAATSTDETLSPSSSFVEATPSALQATGAAAYTQVSLTSVVFSLFVGSLTCL